jgi:hypothetical protein
MLHVRLAQPDFTFVWLVNATQDFDERALARAIVSDQRDNFPRIKVYGHRIQREHAAKVLGDADASDEWMTIRSAHRLRFAAGHLRLTHFYSRCHAKCVAPFTNHLGVFSGSSLYFITFGSS